LSAERPVTLGIDIGVIKMIITHAAAVHGLDISPEPVDLARVALKRLGNKQKTW
jgi:methylase of polypeptide subunit release factors